MIFTCTVKHLKFVKNGARKAQVEVTSIYGRTFKSYDILKVKNIFVESAYHVMGSC